MSAPRVDPLALQRALRDSGLTLTQRALCFALGSRADADGVCWPSYGTLAQDSALSRAMVTRLLPELRALGLLTWSSTRTKHGGAGSNRYRLAPCPGPAWEAVRHPDRAPEARKLHQDGASPVQVQRAVLGALAPLWRVLRRTEAQVIAPADRAPLLALWSAAGQPDPVAFAGELALVYMRMQAHQDGAPVTFKALCCTDDWPERRAAVRAGGAGPGRGADLGDDGADADTGRPPAPAKPPMSDALAWAHIVRACQRTTWEAARQDPDAWAAQLLGPLDAVQDEALQAAGDSAAVWTAQASEHPAALASVRRAFLDQCALGRQS